MFNATGLLGSLLQKFSAPSAGQRFGNALAQNGEEPAPLSSLLSQFGSGTGGGVLGTLLNTLSGRSRAPEADKQRFMVLARQAVSSPEQELAQNNPLAVGGLGVLVGTLAGGGRGAIGGGLLAVLASLAYSALRSGDAPAPSAAPQSGSAGYAAPNMNPAIMDTPEEVQRVALLVLRSMIQAARSDGHIDTAEIERIMEKIDEHDPAATAAARNFALDQMRGPPDTDGLVREIRSPLDAAKCYAAALMAVELDTPVEREYVARLARSLGLQDSTIEQLHASLGVPPPHSALAMPGDR